MTRAYDAIIVGGGPAGVSAALTLCQAGLTPLIIERSIFPRFHIGESLLPKGMQLLRELGVLDRIEAEGFIVKPGARFYSNDGPLDVTMSFKDAHDGHLQPTALQVERERFDELLLQSACAAGAELWTLSEVTAIDIEPDRVRATVDRGDAKVTVTAPVIFDATGQHSFSSRVGGYRRRIARLLTHAFFGYFVGLERRTDAMGGNITVAFLPGGWLWYIPLRHDVTSVGVVLLDDTPRPAGGPKEILLTLMQKYLPNAEADFRPKLISTIRAYSAINFCATRYADDRLMLVGDSAAFLDPVFSTGVYLGMWGGRRAAQAAIEGLKKGDLSREAFLGYERSMRELHQIGLELVDMFYKGRFVTLLQRVQEGERFAVPDISSLLSGDFINDRNSLSIALRKRTRPDVPLCDI